jgi:hypothetical protein
MSLLIPELERQLRAVVSDAVAPRDRAGGARRRTRARLGTLLAAAGVAIAIAIGVGVLALVHARRASTPTAGSQQQTRPSVPTSTSTSASFGPTSCPQPRAPGPTARLYSGEVAGMPWSLRVSNARPRELASARVVIADHAFPACPLSDGFALLHTDGVGVVFGFVTGTSHVTVSIGGAPPPILHRLDGGWFYLGALPRAACAYHVVTVGVRTQSRQSPASEIFYESFSGCQPWRLRHATSGSPNSMFIPPPAGLTRRQAARFNRGAEVVGEAGCLACHVIGLQGNNGPGPPLSTIGSQLSLDQLRRTLLHPRAPMPSFRGLPARKLRDLLYFLSQLRR